MSRGFSLIELLIVAVIIAVIVAIAVPRVTEASRNAAAASVAAHLRTMATAFDLYNAEHGSWPRHSETGAMPPEMQGRLLATDFGSSPAGGMYRWDNWIDGGITLGGVWVSVHTEFGTPFDTALFAQVDALLDDGDLTTGRFVRKSTSAIGTGRIASLRLDEPQ